MSYYVNPHAHQCPWYPYAELFGSPNIQWCEETMCHWVSEPANTYSNFAYIAVALILAIITKSNSTKQTDVFIKIIFGLGIASGFYHMSGNFLGQIFDFIFIFLFMFWGVAFNLKKLDKIQTHNQQWKVTIAITSLFMIAVFIMYFTYFSFQLLIPIAAALLIYSEFRAKNVEPISFKFLYSSLAIIIIAQVFSFLDRTGTLCEPTNHNFQGHALWHVLSAIGLGLAFMHYNAQVEPEIIETKFDEPTENDFDEVYVDTTDIDESHPIEENEYTEISIEKSIEEPIISPEQETTPKLNTGEDDVDPLLADPKIEIVDDSQLGFDSLIDEDDQKDKN